jgi:cell division protein FtsX
MGVIRHKIWSDLWNNKGRTLQVVLIIAMGAFAIGMIIGASSIVRVRLAEVWQSSSPATINLWADPQVSDEQLTALKSLAGVEDVEGFMSTSLEWRLSPTDPWQSGTLVARADYDDKPMAL